MADKPDELTRGGITRQEFARRLDMKLKAKGWSQSELSRRSTVQRDSVSAYCRGRSFPLPEKLDLLAKALDCEPSDLIPNQSPRMVEARAPRFQIEALPDDGGFKLLTVNKMRIPNDVAAKIFAFLLECDTPGEATNGAH
jgi:transcriptional regulator with XRE-family HTH domain